MRNRLVLLGWLFVGALLMLLAPWEGSRSSFTALGAERLVLFALEDGGHASFKVGRDDDGVRVLAYLETERPEILDEAETWLFGMGIDLVGEQTTSYREHWTRSRLTVLPDKSLAINSPDPSRVITDSRIIDLIPGPHMDQGGELIVRPKGLREGERLLVRVFRENRDDGVGVVNALSRTALERIERLYPLPWPALSERELRWHTGLKRLTIPAHDLVGDTVAVHKYVPPSHVPTSVSRGYRMEPGEATAVNLRGPSVLEIVAGTDSLIAELDDDEPLPPSTMPIFKVVDASFTPVEGGTVTPSRIVVPDGAIWSVHWMNGWDAEPITLGFTLTPDQGKSWGEPPGAGGGEPQEPERRRITSYRAGPDLGPIDVPAVAARDWGHLRVEARPLSDAVWKASPATDPGQPPVNITWEALDADGEVLDTGVYPARWDHAPYERYVEAELERVSEKTTRYVYHRREAVTLRFTADRLVDLRFLYPLDVVPLRAPEYGLPEDFTGRYAPWELANYLAVAPTNHDDLVLDERLQRFDATVRIEHRGEGEQSGDRRTWVVTPWNVDAMHPVVERVTPKRGWKAWYRTQIDGLTRLLAGDEGVRVDFRVDADKLGEEARLVCAGVDHETYELEATTGSLDWALPEGENDCELQGPEGLWLARAEGDGPTWARRTLWRADTMTLRVSAWLDEPTEILYVRAYTASGNAPELHVTIDGGDLGRRPTSSAHHTPASRRFTPLEPRGWGQLVNGGRLQAWQGMRVFMGDDLARGMHQVEIRAVGQGGEPVYVRMDGSWHEARDGSTRHWTEDAE